MAAALVEAPGGLALLLLPGPTVAVLLGAWPDGLGLMIGRLTGLALLAVGISCWGASRDSGGAARAATLVAITLYSVGSGLLLLLFALTGQGSGYVIWGAGVIHLAFAAGFAASARRAHST
jgi:hypothetical protein